MRIALDRMPPVFAQFFCMACDPYQVRLSVLHVIVRVVGYADHPWNYIPVVFVTKFSLINWSGCVGQQC